LLPESAAKIDSCPPFTTVSPERIMPLPAEKLKFRRQVNLKEIKIMATKSKAKKPVAKKPAAKKKK
jgi:hypothetical protein